MMIAPDHAFLTGDEIATLPTTRSQLIHAANKAYPIGYKDGGDAAINSPEVRELLKQYSRLRDFAVGCEGAVLDAAALQGSIAFQARFGKPKAEARE